MELVVFLVSLFGFLALGIPIAIVLVLCSMVLMYYGGMWDSMFVMTIPQSMLDGANNYPLMAIPFFVFAGEIMTEGGLSKRVVKLAQLIIGRVRGGLGYAAIVSSVIFAGLMGSSVGEAAALGSLLLPMMAQAGYKPGRAGGVIASGAIPKTDPFLIDRVAAIAALKDCGVVVVLNKCDLMPEKEKQQELVEKFRELGYEAFPVSAATRQGFDKLLDRVVPELPPPRVFMEEEEEEEPSITDMSFTVTQQKGGVFVVEGPAIQRLIDSVNFEDEESMNWFHRQLRDRGIIDELRKKGAKEGSPVQLGDMEFDFIE